MTMHCPVVTLMVIFAASLCSGHEQHGLDNAVRTGDVIVLNDDNFAARLADVELALVKFYAPWCGMCKQLAPEFVEAASMLKEFGQSIMLAEVDCTDDGAKTVCSDNGVDRYPVLRVFRRGKFSFDYSGQRRSSAIAAFMKSKLGPSSKELQSIDDFNQFLNYTELIAIGFFEADAKQLNETFHGFADLFGNRIRFGHTFNPEICAKYSYKNAIVLFREPRFQSKFEPSQIPFSGEATIDNLQSWVMANVNSLVGHRTRRNVAEFKSPTVIVYYDVDYHRNAKGTNYWRNRIVKIANRFADEGRNVSFAISNAHEMKEELTSFGFKVDNLPVAAVRDYTADQKFKMTDEFSIENFEKFVESFLDGRIKPYIKSEPIPETNDDPVKVVVGETFKEMVNDETKDVLIEMYSPMCGHCMVLTPKYEKLAIKLKDETDLVIAKIDGTVNEVPDIYDIQGYPAIFFVPMGAKNDPIPYTGKREVDDFVEFLAKHSTSPLKGYDREGRPVTTKSNKRHTPIEL